MCSSLSKSSFEINPGTIKLEIALLQKKYDILNEREKALHRLCTITLNHKKNSKDLQQFLADMMKILFPNKAKK